MDESVAQIYILNVITVWECSIFTLKIDITLFTCYKSNYCSGFHTGWSMKLCVKCCLCHIPKANVGHIYTKQLASKFTSQLKHVLD